MKNLFDYATKELSQDAFLRWFFENYDDRRLRSIVFSFLRTFAKGIFADIKDEDIVSITTYTQDRHIDITVEVKLKGNDKEETGYVYIEDKVLSGEHNQLLRYNKVIDASRSERIYYKTSLIDEDERERVKAANWSIYDINDSPLSLGGIATKTIYRISSPITSTTYSAYTMISMRYQRIAHQCGTRSIGGPSITISSLKGIIESKDAIKATSSIEACISPCSSSSS